jgi:hypothetical protein
MIKISWSAIHLDYLNVQMCIFKRTSLKVEIIAWVFELMIENEDREWRFWTTFFNSNFAIELEELRCCRSASEELATSQSCCCHRSLSPWLLHSSYSWVRLVVHVLVLDIWMQVGILQVYDVLMNVICLLKMLMWYMYVPQTRTSSAIASCPLLYLNTLRVCILTVQLYV